LEKDNLSSPAGVAVEDNSMAAKEEAYERFVWDNLKRNYIGNYIHGMLGMTGFRLVNAPTFLPAYLHLISGSNAVVGLALGLQQLGSVISPVFGATQIEHRTKVMPAAVWMGGLARVQIVGMALAGWFLHGQPLIIAMMALMFLFGLFMGTQRVVFGFLMAKVIPLSRRGRLQAWRNATGSLIAAALAYAAGKYIIKANLFGNGYSTTFALSAILTTMGLWALQVLIREPEPPNLPARTGFRDRLKDFPQLILGDRGYAWFLVMQMLGTAGRAATPFYAIYVTHQMTALGAVSGLAESWNLSGPAGSGLHRRRRHFEPCLGLSGRQDRLQAGPDTVHVAIHRLHDPAHERPRSLGLLPGLLRAGSVPVGLYDGGKHHDPGVRLPGGNAHAHCDLVHGRGDHGRPGPPGRRPDG